MCPTARVTYAPADLTRRGNKLYVNLSRRPVRGKFGVGVTPSPKNGARRDYMSGLLETLPPGRKKTRGRLAVGKRWAAAVSSRETGHP